MLVRVEAASRLHFGLLRLPQIGDAAEARLFGGAGLMVCAPQLRVALRPSPAWAARGPLAERALVFARKAAQRLATRANAPSVSYEIDVEAAPPEHNGLGSGTQLALAVTRALAVISKQEPSDASSLATLVDRGARSAIGIHGFDRGGFLVDGGKGPHTRIAPLLVRCDFPDDWHLLLVLPGGKQGRHGAEESDVFAQPAPPDTAGGDALCRLLLLCVLPALHERDLTAFGEALFEFNRRVGEIFRRWQGGLYADSQTEAVIDFIRRQGIAGTGQSSWGPAVFAVADPERVQHMAAQVGAHFRLSPAELLVTQAQNHGAQVEYEPTL